MIDELQAVLKAREIVRKVNPAAIPVSVSAYADHVGATIRYDNDMGPDESGYSFATNGKYYICANVNDGDDRQRFTICHEVAHIVLGLPSEHHTTAWSYARKSMNEILCDVFAAELLLPVSLFKPLADRTEIGFAAINELAGRFEASPVATGSRFATMIKAPCAFVFSEGGKVRYTSRSALLREAYGWVAPRQGLPAGTLSARTRAGEDCNGAEEVATEIWFENWQRGGTLLEEARHYTKWDQTLTLLWFEDEELPPLQGENHGHHKAEEEQGLAELDGMLPWPGRNRRRR